MTAEEMFEGFSFTAESIAHLETLARDRDGEQVSPYFDEVKQRTQNWTAEDYQLAEQEAYEIERRVLALFRAGVAFNDPRVFTVLDDDFAAQSRIWTPDRDTYAKLGQAIVDTPELRAHLDTQDHALADYLRDAMAAYAAARLA